MTPRLRSRLRQGTKCFVRVVFTRISPNRTVEPVKYVDKCQVKREDEGGRRVWGNEVGDGGRRGKGQNGCRFRDRRWTFTLPMF